MSDRPLAVGFLGAGPVTQAIHLPALARLRDDFRVAAVMDLDADVAASVAARVGARPCGRVEELLADDVDVVAVCSPHQFHAEGVIAACHAGKRAVLCEKPFAMDAEQAHDIAVVARETGVPVVVGAMHVYDPGWRALADELADLEASAHTVRSSIVLPPNPRFEDFATEVVTRPAPPHLDADDPEVAAGMVHAGVLGLAIHDLPLVRRFLPEFRDVTVLHAEALRPFGYLIVLRSGDRTVELHATMSANWSPCWAFSAVGDDAVAEVEFTPSYVQAGSAVGSLRTSQQTVTYGPYADNGYVGEWREVAALARGAEPVVDVERCIDDLVFALTVAEQSREAAHARLVAA